MVLTGSPLPPHPISHRQDWTTFGNHQGATLIPPPHVRVLFACTIQRSYRVISSYMISFENNSNTSLIGSMPFPFCGWRLWEKGSMEVRKRPPSEWVTDQELELCSLGSSPKLTGSGSLRKFCSIPLPTSKESDDVPQRKIPYHEKTTWPLDLWPLGLNCNYFPYFHPGETGREVFSCFSKLSGACMVLRNQQTRSELGLWTLRQTQWFLSGVSPFSPNGHSKWFMECLMVSVT